MIDNPLKTKELIKKMEACLPIPATPAKILLNKLRKKDAELSSGKRLYIEKVHYLGDEGGICCEISMSENSKQAVVVSLTHLRVPPSHPLSKEMTAYQEKRIRKLKKMDLGAR